MFATSRRAWGTGDHSRLAHIARKRMQSELVKLNPLSTCYKEGTWVLGAPWHVQNSELRRVPTAQHLDHAPTSCAKFERDTENVSARRSGTQR